ncbi:alpha/beta hydrolase [Streptomyces sp. WAC05374]|uniref:alpha/beta hydrolase family protein n=1 Tax=Streptomyces sp. WAC05374 TaxID=2487420 RepID=UPI000F863665|nr:dienelactone hydrolase family protein [Streptomyces sp. WAC05374]RST19574.1 alpha/beta hydrolase [Streptomyces sp. WAC05374]TDF50089.1 alpha/beta hydrolase [Streptomyces sp. WAC05374]TDF57815.1 alpha/beta hydrolase [Streptomyces sp. WAC05374]TDF60343.1 alpha/beta hydrolase [Streptomyces sp. WAC05374]
MKTLRTLRPATATVVALISLGMAVPAAHAQAPARPERAAVATTAPTSGPARPAATGVVLPEPTGRAEVGRSTLHLVDPSRQDLWVPERRRELMVDLYYPARSTAGAPSRYSDRREAELLLAEVGVRDESVVETLSATRTHSAVHARPRPGKHPLVLLSPGFGAPRFTLTTLAEDLASRGYVVAAVDHAYESSGTVFPGGRVLTCVACRKAETEEDIRRATVNRGQDLSFVLDRLTGPRPAWRYAGLVDRQRMGAAGHSLGGAAAASVMANDDRVRAGVNMDGAFGDPVPEQGLGGRPFLMLGTGDAVHQPGGEDATWDAAWRNLDGWKRWLAVTGAHHFTFSDVPVLFDQLRVPYPDAQPTIPATRAISVVRTYTGAFFDLHLRGRPQPLLDGPTVENPEVRFNHHGG